MNLYFESSALVKRYVRGERGSDDVDTWFRQADAFICSRIGYTEVFRAIHIGRLQPPADAFAEFEREWYGCTVIDVNDEVVRTAGRVAVRHRLRSLDAIHLASALTVRRPDLHMVVFDAALRGAALAEGLSLLPP